GGSPCIITSAIYERTANAERIVIKVIGDVSWKSAWLDKTAAGHPSRLYVDLNNTQPSKEAKKSPAPESPIIQQIRIGARDATTTRVVLDLAAPLAKTDYSVYQSSDTSGVIIEIPLKERLAAASAEKKPAPPPAAVFVEPSEITIPVPQVQPPIKQKEVQSPKQNASGRAAQSEEKNQKEARKKPQQAAPGKEPAPVIALKNPDKCVIVIDPGHGGKDPGALGCQGIQEKDIALAIARELKKTLDADSRCRTIMTRNSDRFVSLEDRARMANKNEADLFISIHANANEDSRLNGTETYYLDFSSDADARRVAARENFTTPDAIGDLEMILFDLLQSDKINQSSIFAGHMHNALMSSLRARYPDARNLGVKHAPLKVLVDAEMPCLILETAFISNPEEAERLKNPEHQKLLAQAITDGIGSFLQGARAAANRGSRAEM
ncbi:MAG: N-acetylmuramoyl-L-alanine amidase, partial [Proteobacteria bacterium]|nr:N-acetylmuramoyl-L-alanine amidase [Pseudomonadota bacterium]